MSAYLRCTRLGIVAAAACWTLFTIGTPPAAADPSTDALGFVDSSARCAAPNTAVAFGSTANSRVAICKSPAGLYGYHGVRISDGAKLIASATASADGSFVAQAGRRHLHGDVECAGGQRRQWGGPSGTDGVVPRTEDRAGTSRCSPDPGGQASSAGRDDPDDSAVEDGAATTAAARRSRRRQALVRLRRSRNRLTHGVAVDSLDPEFTTVAAVLDAAEWGGGIHDVALVDAEGA